AGTLEALRRRMTPGSVIDETVDYARDTPVAEFFHNLARDVRDYPLPLLLIGAGVAWLIVASSLKRRTVVVRAAAIDPGARLRSPAAFMSRTAPRGEWEVASVSGAATD